jgi:ribosomal protein S18 acetylase RimI-like enzyme
VLVVVVRSHQTEVPSDLTAARQAATRVGSGRESAASTRHSLDNPAYFALDGPHSQLAQRRGGALRYPADMCPFAALPARPGASDWADLAALAGPGSLTVLAAVDLEPPEGWTTVARIPSVQLVDGGVAPVPDDQADRLGPADAQDMLSLVERTKPGPFAIRTVELGTYLGFHRNGELIAMAGERLAPPGWTEVSAVCTDPGWRGHGFASRLSRAVAAGIIARGDIPFLHALATNVPAVRLYKELGFTYRCDIQFRLLRRRQSPLPGQLPA